VTKNTYRYVMNISKMYVWNGNYRLTLHLHCPRNLRLDAFPTKFKHFNTNKPRHNTEISYLHRRESKKSRFLQLLENCIQTIICFVEFYNTITIRQKGIQKQDKLNI